MSDTDPEDYTIETPEFRLVATTDNSVRKEEFVAGSNKFNEILEKVTSSKLQGNEDKITMAADDGNVIAVYFGVKCLGAEPPVFDDIEFLHNNVEMVSLKYIKETDEHYYKYYVRFNPLNIQMDNIVSTGFTTNDQTKATVYIVPKLHEVEEDNAAFFFENYKGITIDIATGDTIMETDYEPTSPEGSQG